MKGPDHYETLGVGRDASPEEVRRAFRKKAKATHPDKGGALVAFQQVQRAYATLRVPSSREAYDRTGRDPSPDPNRQRTELMMELAGLAIGLLEHLPEGVDLIAAMRESLRHSHADMLRSRATHERAILKRERAAKRIHRRHGSGPNLIAEFFLADVQKLRDAIARIDEACAKTTSLLEMVDEYEYESVATGSWGTQ